MAKRAFQLLPEPTSKGQNSAKLQIDVPSEAVEVLDEAKRLCGLSRKALITHLFCNVITPMLREEIGKRKATQDVVQSGDKPNIDGLNLDVHSAVRPTQSILFAGGEASSET